MPTTWLVINSLLSLIVNVVEAGCKDAEININDVSIRLSKVNETVLVSFIQKNGTPESDIISLRYHNQFLGLQYVSSGLTTDFICPQIHLKK